MSPRLEGIQRIAHLLGDNFVTMENHARSMGPAPGNYSTKIGRGHRNVDLSAQWIVSVFLAGVRNDPKSATTKVPELGSLVPSEIVHLETSIKFDDPSAEINQLFSMDYTGEKNVHPAFLKENHDSLFSFICSLVEITGHWLVEDRQEEKCPLPSGLMIKIISEPEQMVSVSFFIFKNRLIEGSDRAVRHYSLAVREAKSTDENEVIPLERAAITSHAHILRLGGIYAFSLNEQKKQIIVSAHLPRLTVCDAPVRNLVDVTTAATIQASGDRASRPHRPVA